MRKNQTISRHLFFLTVILILSILLLIAVYVIGFVKFTMGRANVYFNIYAKQLTEHIESMLDDTEQFINTLIYSQNIQAFSSAEKSYDRYKASISAVDNLNTVMQVFPMIRSIRLVRRDGIAISSGYNYRINSAYNLVSEIIVEHRLMEASIKSPFYTDIYEYEGQQYCAYVTPVFSSEMGNQSKDNIGVIIAVCDVNVFSDMISSTSYIPAVVFSLNFGNYQFFSTSDIEHNKRITLLLSKEDNNAHIMLDRGRYIGGNTCIQNTNWIVQYWANTKDLVSGMEYMLLIGLLIFGIIVIFLVIQSISLYRRITRPIHEIIMGLKNVQQTGQHLPPLESIRNELQEIVLNVNCLLDRLQNISNEKQRIANNLHIARLEAMQAELVYYQKQIEPHFLFNCMECIRSMAVDNCTESIEQFSKSLGRVFRYSIEPNTVVKLSTELSCVRDYFNVMTMRFPCRYSLRTNVPDKWIDIPILKMTLQPLVENSLLHSHDAAHAHINISIQLRVLQGIVHLAVSDNGCGMTPGKIAEIRSLLAESPSQHLPNARHLGLLNVHRRIVLKYGGEYGLKIWSVYMHYTSVEITFPAEF